MVASAVTGTETYYNNGWYTDTSTAGTGIFELPLKGWATDYFFPNTPPFKLEYKIKPSTFRQKILKQPVSKSGFKRGQRR